MNHPELAAPAAPLAVAAAPSILVSPDLRRVALITLAGVIGGFALVAASSLLLREPLSVAAHWIVGALGLPGIFGGVLFADATMFPLPPDLYLLAAVAGALRPVAVVAVISAASILAGTLAWGLGPKLRHLPILGRRLELHRPQGEAFFRRFGVWAVVLAAVTPLPYSAFAWLAGTYRMPFWLFLGASLFRIPRFAFYFLVFDLGWAG